MADARHVIAASSLTDERVRVLKHGDTFALFDQHGDIRSSEWEESGMYHDGTRFLSRCQLELECVRPFLLSSTVRDDNDQLVVTMTNPDLFRDGSLYLPLGSLHLASRKLLWMGALHQELRIENHALVHAEFHITIHFGADFVDIYEVRGIRRNARGRELTPDVMGGHVRLQYLGLDGLRRRAEFEFNPTPDQLNAACARYDLNLAPQDTVVIHLSVACGRDGAGHSTLSFDHARAEIREDLESRQAQLSRIETENGQFNALIRRATADLHMLTTMLPTGLYPYAGVPWFNTPFGRDGIITAFECLAVNPVLARGVLAYLARTQATEAIAEQDAEPGKILHEIRNGEMAALSEMPFARYYGAVDATPLFVYLAGAYYERTGDRRFIEQIWTNIESALQWMERYGDCDGDGFIEYRTNPERGLLHQGWKDSDDAVFHSDGSLAEGPIALCEVQGYAYAAWKAGASLASIPGDPQLATKCHARADELRGRFDKAFWCDELATYALAMDGAKRLCRVRTSNTGQCLFTGIPTPQRARRIARTLHRPEFFSGWGIRTLAMEEPRYNPMGYHTGSVWPHDNALIAYGMGRYGMSEDATRIFTGVFEAATYFDLCRLPELFCGFARERGEGPVLYSVACAPQAWSAASVFLFLQGSLGLSIDALQRKISFVRPSLPPFLNSVRISNLAIGNGRADLLVVRHENDISVKALHIEEDFEVVVLARSRE